MRRKEISIISRVFIKLLKRGDGVMMSKAGVVISLCKLQPDKLLLLLLWIKAWCVPAADCPHRERTGLLV